MNVEGAAALAEAYPEAVKKVGVMVPNFPATIDYTQRALGTFPTVGWQFLDCTQTYPITGVTDFRPFLQKLKDCGAEVVFTTDTATTSRTSSTQPARSTSPHLDGHQRRLRRSFANWNVNGNADKVYFGNVFVPARGHHPRHRQRRLRRHRDGPAEATSPTRASRRPAPSCCGPPRPRRAATTSPGRA